MARNPTQPPSSPSSGDDDDPGRELSSETTAEYVENDGGTRVDMGDDLIEKTAVLRLPGSLAPSKPPPLPGADLPGASLSAPAPEPVLGGEALPPTGPLTLEQISDQMQSARILMGEGILEDAKRILRRILLTDPSLVEARKMLEEIHETELKQIFGESETPRHRFRRAAEPVTPIEISADIVMKGLDRDLKLGIFDERGDDGGEGRAAQLSLFKDKAAMERFGAKMDEDFGGFPAAERIDLGIAFLEMGLHDLAVRHFQAAASRLVLEELKEGTPREPALAATGLLAYALILGGRAFEATIRLQPLLNDVEIEKSRKLDLIYLMGRAFEAMGKLEEARQWFGQAAEIDPAYRDVLERLRRAGGTVPS